MVAGIAITPGIYLVSNQHNFFVVSRLKELWKKLVSLSSFWFELVHFFRHQTKVSFSKHWKKNLPKKRISLLTALHFLLVFSCVHLLRFHLRLDRFAQEAASNSKYSSHDQGQHHLSRVRKFFSVRIFFNWKKLLTQ